MDSTGKYDVPPEVVKLPFTPKPSHLAVNQVAMTDAAAVVKALNPQRYSIVVKNIGAKTGYLGPTNGVTSATGIPLIPNESLALEYTGDLYGICAAGEATIFAYAEEAY